MALNSRTSAFSLVEVLITISIIAIASVIVLVGLGNGRTEKELEGAAQQAASAVRDAQNKALTGRQFIDDTTPCAYRFSWSGSGGSVIYVYKNGDVCSSTATVSSISLVSGVLFANSDVVEFSLPHGKTSVKEIILTKSGQSKAVCVRDGGLVEILSGASCP